MQMIDQSPPRSRRKAARINPMQAPYTAEALDLLKKWTPPNCVGEPPAIFKVLFRFPDVWDRMKPLVAFVLAHSSLPPVEKELIILRICARCGSEYEWGMHAAGLAQKLGLSDAALRSSYSPTPSPDGSLSDKQRLLMAIVDELFDAKTISGALWEQTKLVWSEKQLLEIIVSVGCYQMVAMLVNSLDLPNEQWARSFPAP